MLASKTAVIIMTMFNALSLFSVICSSLALPNHITHSRPPGLICKENEHFVRHNLFCPITCENRYIISPSEQCKPRTGCFCDPGYIRLFGNATGPCIPDDSCPPDAIKCSYNEEITDCVPHCVESCESLHKPCNITAAVCTPGCKCKANYLRNELGICIPKEHCPPSPYICEDKCIPTCAVPNPPGCPYEDNCECAPGHIMSEINGECIKIENCPQNIGCNGDTHARIKQCPVPCPSTCQAPNAGHCLKTCDRVGCECEQGYILSEINGKCILPDQCKGGYPCKANETFVSCRSQCNANYCPTDDSIQEILCELPSPCLSGCSCKFNYKRIGGDDGACIAAAECPPVNCTRPNEFWNPCPSPCLRETCEDMDYSPIRCNAFAQYCNPRCVCKEHYFRDDSYTCVTPNECPYYFFD